MNIVENFLTLFAEVWNKGILGIDIFQILIGLGIFLIFLLFRGFISKIINYTSTRITDLNKESMDLIKKYPPNITLIYSQRSAESFDGIIRKYSLAELMTQCTVMCISKKIEEFLKSKGWKKTEIFSPGEELIKIDQIKNEHC